MFRRKHNHERTKCREHDLQLRDKQPARRFRIEKLEDRIAPTHRAFPGKYCFVGCQLHDNAPMPWGPPE